MARSCYRRLVVQFVVEVDGRVDPATLQVLTVSRSEFEQAVREALPGMRFLPAQLGGRDMRQIVQQPFFFKIESAGSTVVYGNSVTPVGQPSSMGELTHIHVIPPLPPSPPPAMCTSSTR
jgi:hypothetical protein